MKKDDILEKVKAYNEPINQEDLIAVHFKYALVGRVITEEEYDYYFKN